MGLTRLPESREWDRKVDWLAPSWNTVRYEVALVTALNASKQFARIVHTGDSGEAFPRMSPDDHLYPGSSLGSPERDRCRFTDTESRIPVFDRTTVHPTTKEG